MFDYQNQHLRDFVNQNEDPNFLEPSWSIFAVKAICSKKKSANKVLLILY